LSIQLTAHCSLLIAHCSLLKKTFCLCKNFSGIKIRGNEIIKNKVLSYDLIKFIRENVFISLVLEPEVLGVKVWQEQVLKRVKQKRACYRHTSFI
jgi:hypothetical protein